VVKVVSPDELSKLVAIADRKGYSRVARDLEIRIGWHYFLMPYLPEPSPESCWICLVVGMENIPASKGDVGQEMCFARLDVRVSTFDRLGDAPIWQRDQLLHWLAWRAAQK
jgi:hypothetical protein